MEYKKELVLKILENISPYWPDGKEIKEKIKKNELNDYGIDYIYNLLKNIINEINDEKIKKNLYKTIDILEDIKEKEMKDKKEKEKELKELENLIDKIY